MTDKTTQAAECLSRLNAELDTTSDKILFYAKDIYPSPLKVLEKVSEVCY